jgi:hypothetical protein
VSCFFTILSLRGRLNLGNKNRSHIYLNLFSGLFALGIKVSYADLDEAALAALALVAGVVGYSEHCAF